MSRGPQKLDDGQLAKLNVVRARRIERDNAAEEWAVRVARLKAEFFGDLDEALKSAVWACVDAGVPASRIKQVLNVSDHRTYKSRFLDGYEKPVTDGWEFTVNAGHATVTRFLRFVVRLQFALQGEQVVVEPKGLTEFDEQELAEKLSAGQLAEEWGMLMGDIRSALKEEYGPA